MVPAYRRRFVKQPRLHILSRHTLLAAIASGPGVFVWNDDRAMAAVASKGLVRGNIQLHVLSAHTADNPRPRVCIDAFIRLYILFVSILNVGDRAYSSRTGEMRMLLSLKSGITAVCGGDHGN
jgi:hypothetical protein